MALGITCNAPPTAVIGSAYSHFFPVVDDVPPDNFTITVGALPAGLTLNALTGEVSGIPTGPAGNSAFTIQVEDSTLATATADCSIDVNDALTLADSPPSGIAGIAYSHTFVAAGGVTPYTFSIFSGSLPPGVTLNTATGEVSGTPTTAGSYTFAIRVIDSYAGSATPNQDIVEATILIDPALAISCDNPPAGFVGIAYSHFFPAVNGTPPYTWAIVAGALPPGLTLNTATGEVSGIPTTKGTYTFTIEVTDSGSPSLTGWVEEDQAEDNSWRGIAWSPDQGLFAAVSLDGANRVMTSPDGITWTAQAAAEANAWAAISWSPDLGLFAAVSLDGANRVMTSPDGITWTAQAAAEANPWIAICWSPEQGLFAAVSQVGANQVMTSPDGIVWTAQLAAEANDWRSIAWSPELGLFAAVSADGANRVMTSPDGITWTAQAAAEANIWVGIAWAPDLLLFAAVSADGANQLMTSPDGINWTSQVASEVNTWAAITWSPELGLFMAVGQDAGDQTMYSADGITWTGLASAQANSWAGIAWSPELGIFAAVALDGVNRVMITTSEGGSQTAEVSCSISIQGACLLDV